MVPDERSATGFVLLPHETACLPASFPDPLLTWAARLARVVLMSENKTPKKRLPEDHPVLGRFLGWLKAVESHAATQPQPAPAQEEKPE